MEETKEITVRMKWNRLSDSEAELLINGGRVAMLKCNDGWWDFSLSHLTPPFIPSVGDDIGIDSAIAEVSEAMNITEHGAGEVKYYEAISCYRNVMYSVWRSEDYEWHWFVPFLGLGGAEPDRLSAHGGAGESIDAHLGSPIAEQAGTP